MAREDSIGPEVLRQLLDYDPEAGVLTWRRRPREFFKTQRAFVQWNNRYPGTEAIGCPSSTGYKHGRVLNIAVLAHRVCWAIYHGQPPRNQIDHINGDGLDNRIVNLRDVNRRENGLNQKIPHDNVSGRIGVWWNERSRMWAAKIGKDNRSISLGEYEDFRLACAARYGAERALGYHLNHGRD